MKLRKLIRMILPVSVGLVAVNAPIVLTTGCTAGDTQTSLEATVEVISIKITSKPNKLEYTQGETLDLSGIVVKANCADGSVKNVNVSSDTKVLNTVGVQKIEVKYQDKSDSFEITVNAKEEKDPEPTPTPVATYIITFNANGGTLSGNSSVSVEENTVFSAVSKPTATRSGYTFKGWDVEDSVKINADLTANALWTKNEEKPVEVVLNSISIYSKPSKLTYTQGEVLDLTGLVVKGNYSDGTSKTISYTANPTNGTVLNTVGTQKITLSYNGKTTYINITVNAKPVVKYTITFNANGGTLSGNSSVSVEENTVFSAVSKPTAARSGYTFKGWDVEDSYKITGNLTANAVWEEIPVEPEPVEIVTWSGETNEEYISNRTISMIERNDDGDVVVGTGWILSDATPNNTSDYIYYVATNAHVAMGFDDFDGGFKYGLLGSRSAIKSSYYDDFFKARTKYVLDNQTNLDYYDATNVDWSLNNYVNEIDLYIQTINLNNFTNEYTGSDKAKKMVKQLKAINSIQAEYGKINQFVDIEDLETSKFYVGGFPEHNGFEYWQFNEIDGDNIAYYEAGEANHNIGNSSKVDNSEQLILQNAVALDWLGAGASGSMLIDEKNQIVGIYWGGFGAEQDGYFYPAFSVVNEQMFAKYI